MIPSEYEPQDVAEIMHEKGTAYHFSQTSFNPWTWQEMVAQMDQESMAFVVQGEGQDHRSRGLVGCGLQQAITIYEPINPKLHFSGGLVTYMVIVHIMGCRNVRHFISNYYTVLRMSIVKNS